MNIFLDANILVSVLNKEYPVFTYSSRVMSLADHNHIHLYTTPICLAISWYFAEKKSGRKIASRKMELLTTYLKIAIVDEIVIHHSLHNKAIEDFEDGLQYYAALKVGCEFIISENPEDFYFAEVPVLRSEDFLTHYLEI